ncbi:MAG TPA: hypothetical protein VGM82_00180 [Gemmatimonadaceae bacterium]|jgi:hypothetical protein
MDGTDKSIKADTGGSSYSPDSDKSLKRLLSQQKSPWWMWLIHLALVVVAVLGLISADATRGRLRLSDVAARRRDLLDVDNVTRGAAAKLADLDSNHRSLPKKGARTDDVLNAITATARRSAAILRATARLDSAVESVPQMDSIASRVGAEAAGVAIADGVIAGAQVNATQAIAQNDPSKLWAAVSLAVRENVLMGSSLRSLGTLVVVDSTASAHWPLTWIVPSWRSRDSYLTALVPISVGLILLLLILGVVLLSGDVASALGLKVPKIPKPSDLPTAAVAAAVLAPLVLIPAMATAPGGWSFRQPQAGGLAQVSGAIESLTNRLSVESKDIQAAARSAGTSVDARLQAQEGVLRSMSIAQAGMSDNLRGLANAATDISPAIARVAEATQQEREAVDSLRVTQSRIADSLRAPLLATTTTLESIASTLKTTGPTHETLRTVADFNQIGLCLAVGQKARGLLGTLGDAGRWFVGRARTPADSLGEPRLRAEYMRNHCEWRGQTAPANTQADVPTQTRAGIIGSPEHPY